jgi:hypothetical protein
LAEKSRFCIKTGIFFALNLFQPRFSGKQRTISVQTVHLLFQTAAAPEFIMPDGCRQFNYGG